MKQQFIADKFQCLPNLGVGIIYGSAIEKMNFPNGLLDVLAIEPQTLCISDKKKHLKIAPNVFEHINTLPYTKLVHSIGAPVGGRLKPSKEQLDLIDYSANLFNSPWISEHLSFNATTEFDTGFFLPPCQTEEGLEQAINNVKIIQDYIKRPLLIETGVNYLKATKHEIPDGIFMAELCKATGCGILLDIHNLFANQLNGRQSIETFLNQVPLEHIVEIHIAGGSEMNGFWLDSHSGPIDDRLMVLTKEYVPHFKNLKAITYEIFESYIPTVGAKGIINELEKVRLLWEEKSKACFNEIPKTPKSARRIQEFNAHFSTEEWEETLGDLVIGRRSVNTLLAAQKENINIYNTLINEFRASMLVRILKLSTTYLMLVLGKSAFITILNDFWLKYPPEQIALNETNNFVSYLKYKAYKMNWLYELLDYEMSVIETLLDQKERIVQFSADPTPMLKALSEYKLPDIVSKAGNYVINITPEEETINWKSFNSL